MLRIDHDTRGLALIRELTRLLPASAAVATAIKESAAIRGRDNGICVAGIYRINRQRDRSPTTLCGPVQFAPPSILR